MSDSTRKAPPRIPSTPATRRVFAHLLSVDIACPTCGTVHPAREHKRRRRHLGGEKGRRMVGYDELTGVFRCRVCLRAYVLGVLFWPLTGARRVHRPADSVPTPGEAVALRQDSSRVVLGSYTESRGHANRMAAEDATVGDEDSIDDSTDDAGGE